MMKKRSAISDQQSAPASRRIVPATSSRLAASHPTRAFTLIELVVVIGIIVALAAIILGVAGALSRKSEADQTRNVLNLMDLAMGEWETSSDRKLSWGMDGIPTPNMKYEIQSGYTSPPPEGVAGAQISDCLMKLRSSTGSKEILARINDKLLVRTNPPNSRILIRDLWDKEIVMVHPGRLPNPLIATDPIPDPSNPINVDKIDKDGTIRTTDALANINRDGSEVRFGICVNRRICFVSGGPDGELGDLHLDVAAGSLTPAQLKDIALAADNIYSYALSQERKQ